MREIVWRVPSDVWMCVERMADECRREPGDIALAALINGLGLCALASPTPELAQRVAKLALKHGGMGQLGQVLTYEWHDTEQPELDVEA